MNDERKRILANGNNVDNQTLLPRIGILGSCVTRDMFKFCKIENLLTDYRARSSICGYGTPGLNEKLDFLDDLSGFRKTTVLKDLTKKELPFTQMDLLLIDLIDERFEIYSKTNTIFTRSTYLAEVSGVAKLKGTKAFERGSEEHFAAFEQGCRKLLEDCKSHGVKPILHQARWAIVKSEENGQSTISNDKKYIERIHRENEILQRLEDIFKKIEPKISTISSQDMCVANPKHKWGLQPFHYIGEYYSNIYEQLTFELHRLDFKFVAHQN
jgi:hypothetical protein